MPTVKFTGGKYAKVEASHPDALKIATPGTGVKEVPAETVKKAKFDSKWEPKDGEYAALVEAGTEYTTYLLGAGVFDYEDLGVKHAHEMVRDAKTNGGEDMLITRRRLVYAPYGISYKTDSTISPEDTELEKGTNWELVKSQDGDVIDHKAIPIARIIPRG